MTAARVVVGHFLRVGLVTWLTLTTLVVAIQYVEQSNRVLDAEAPGQTALHFLFLSFSEWGLRLLPLSTFLGALVSSTLLARRGEWIAFGAAGVSRLRLVAFYGAVVVVIGLTHTWLAEVYLPGANASMERLRREQLQRGASISSFYLKRGSWFRNASYVLHLPEVDVATQGFFRPRIYRLADGLIDLTIEGKILSHDAKRGWEVLAATVVDLEAAEVSRHEVFAIDLNYEPQDLIDVAGDPRTMSRGEMLQLIKRREAAGFLSQVHRVELHQRFAEPWAGLVLLLLLSGALASTDRRRTVAGTIGAGVVSIVAYFAIAQFFRFLALSQNVPAWVGPWGPVGLVMVVAVTLILGGRLQLDSALTLRGQGSLGHGGRRDQGT